MSFDIAEKEQELVVEDAGVVVAILDANDEPVASDDGTPVTWTVCGINSKQYRKAEAWQTKTFRAFRGRTPTADEQQTMQCEFIARCSLGFAGFTNKGAVVTFSTENATNILARIPYIRRRIEAAMGDHAGFTKTPSAN